MVLGRVDKAVRFDEAIVAARRARELYERSTVRPTGALAYLFAGHADKRGSLACGAHC